MSGEATSRGQFRKRSSGCRRTRIGTHPISHGLRAAGPVLLKTSRPHCERDVGGRHQDRHSALRSRPSWRHLETAAVLGAWTVAGPSSARSVPIACSRRSTQARPPAETYAGASPRRCSSCPRAGRRGARASTSAWTITSTRWASFADSSAWLAPTRWLSSPTSV